MAKPNGNGQDILDPTVDVLAITPTKTDLFFADAGEEVLATLPAGEKRRLLIELKGRLIAGEDPDEIAEAMGISIEMVDALHRELRRLLAPRIVGLRNEDIYVDFVLAAKGEIRELDKLIQSQQVEVVTDETAPVALDGGKTPVTVSDQALQRKTAVVSVDPKVCLGAIKRKGEIRREIIQVGQELGLIHKAPIKHQTVGGYVVADLSNMELQKLLLEELKTLEYWMQFGNRDVLGNPIPDVVDREKRTNG
jgi:hypothetical protein